MASLAAMVSTAFAQCEDLDPTQCTVPNHIVLVGHDGLITDPWGSFEVVLRDDHGVPLSGVLVTLDFDYQAAHDRILCINEQFWPGLSQSGQRISRYTDANGSAVFRITGYGMYHSGCNDSGPWYKSMGVYACNNRLVKPVYVAIADLDGNGVGGSDLSKWLSDYGCADGTSWYRARSDYNGDSFINGADLSIWQSIWGDGGSYDNCD